MTLRPVSIWSYIQLPIACREVKPVESQNQLNGKSVKDSVKQEVNIHPMKSGNLNILDQV